MKRENTRRWKLSSKGRLAALIGLSLVAAQPLMAQSITPVGATSVSSKNGVPVVNIVAPNAQGLSYNQYSNYNVPTQGAVLNNATVAGTSQLAGQLGANANLRGQSANVILNEVVSNNPSLLLGKQEVFGMAANLVLANPNGITCNGCGFINTPSASLVVGKPELSNGALSSYQVGANGNSNALNVTGHVGGADVLNLIAPRVNVNGNVSANSAINVKSGRQHVRADGSLATTPLSAAEQAAPQGVTTAVLDGAILGSMYAGAIRIHNTDATATTSVQGSLNGTSLVDVNTAGNLKVTASQIKGGDVALAANNLDVQGQIQSRDSSTGNSSYNFASMVSSKTSNTSHDEAFSATQISGNQVDLSAAGSNTLNAVQIKAQNLHVSGGTVQLGSTTTNSTSGSTVEQSRFAWNNKNHTTQQTQNLYGNNWQVAQDANIKATSGAVNAQAASVSAGGDLSVSGSQAVNLSGAVAQNSSSNTVNYVAQGNALQTGRNVTASSQQNFTGTSLQAGGNVAIGSSGGNVALQGTQVSGQQVALTSQGTTSIGSQTSQNTSTNSVDFLNAGGIAGGENHHNSTTSITQHGSSIQGQHVAVNGNGGVSVTASAINGTNGVQLASSDGDVKLGYAFNNTSGTSGNRHGAAFNITDASDATTTSADTTVGSSVTSQSAITLSGNNVGAAGSAVSAGQALNLNAANAVTTDIADAQTGSTKQNYTLGFAGYASQNGSALQYTAGLNLQGVTTTTGQSSGLATANSLSGSTVNIQGGNAVALKGSQIAASSGPVTITAPNVTVAAGDSKSSSSDNNTQLSNGGPFISAGLNGLFIGVQAGGAKTENHTETHDAVVSTIQAPGNVSLQAGQTLQNKGTIITTPGQIKLSAPTVLTDAAAKVTTNTVTTSQGGVTLQGYAKLAPSVGMGTIANGQGSTTVNSNSVAVASQFNGGQINVDGSQSVTDTGTRYAATSDVNIQAPAYTGNAAHNAQVSTVNSGNATLGLDVYTTTFADVNAQIGLKGAYQYQQTGQSQAVLGNIQAQNVNITADKSINSSMNIDAANNATLSAGQDVTLAQANNQQWRLQGGFSAGGSIGVQFVPPGAVTPSGSVSGSINYLNVQDSQAVASSVKAGNNVALSATGSATAQGAQVTAGNAFSMQADQVAFNAGNDYHKASGVSTDGTASLKLGFSKSGEVGSGTAGIGGDLAVVHENGYTEHGGSITAQNVNLTANSASQDLTVAGATINATNVNLSNAAGNVSVVAAKGASQKANVGFGANLGAGASKSKGLSSFNVGGHLNITTDDSTYYKLGQINAQNVSIAAGKDFNLQGGVQTDSLNGKVSGNVNISSPQTRQNTLQLDLAANVGDSVIFNPKSTATDYIKAIGNDISSQNGSPNKSSSSQQSLFGITLNGLFNLQAHDSLTTQASKVNVGQMNLVPDGGQVSINAAQVSSSGGQGFGNAKVNTSSNQDYVHAMSGSISGGLPSIPAILTNLANGTPVPPPVTATTPQLTWTQSQVDPSVSVK